MCGIIGYIGHQTALPILTEALSRLEYRGYDSAGVAVVNGSALNLCKRSGKLKELIAAVEARPLPGTLGIGHTRWATHGEPSEVNAHPHTDCTGRLAVVHNGIIENFAALKARLKQAGHRFRSATDTEVIAHLVEEQAKTAPLVEAVQQALGELEGSYAIGLISSDDPTRLIAARHGSPLVIGLGKDEQFLASDVPALLRFTRRVLYLHDREMAVLSRTGARIMTVKGAPVAREATTIQWDLAAAQKGGHPHFMLKEIFEQPQAVAQTLAERISLKPFEVRFDLRTRAFLDELLVGAKKAVIISCGTAYHAGLVGEYMLEECARLPVDVDLASEFRYRGPMVDQETVVIAVTQSGETADTLASLRLAKQLGGKVLAICNVMGSSIAREADAVIYTHAGPEVAVASTKAYTSQLAVFCLVTLYLARKRGLLPDEVWQQRLTELAELSVLMDAMLQSERALRSLKACAKHYADRHNFYYIGRRYNYPSALEGALKLKEICPSIHAEGYAAGEMKHGPISLIRRGWPVVCVTPAAPTYEKMVSNIQEIRARRGEVIAIATQGDTAIRKLSDHRLYIPKTAEIFSPILAAIPLQLLAYYIARRNGCDIDQPPNLAKSVTVE